MLPMLALSVVRFTGLPTANPADPMSDTVSRDYATFVQTKRLATPGKVLPLGSGGHA
jgi:hypothetical protein